MHLDAQDLSIPEGKDGSSTITIEAASVTSDINNVIKDSNARRYELALRRKTSFGSGSMASSFRLHFPLRSPALIMFERPSKTRHPGKWGRPINT